MAQYKSRKDFLENNPRASAFAALAEATKQQKAVTDRAITLKAGQLKGKEVIIIGSGVGGLTTAYELLAQESGAKVTILEALNRTGGRCLTLRTGDILREDKDNKLFGSTPNEPQIVRFKRPVGDSEPYFDAGPGRIPTSHKRLLAYLKKFSVEVEVYIMNSESNLVQKNESFGGKPMVYRRLDHNTRGWLAQMVYSKAEELLKNPELKIKEGKLEERIEALQSLMISFGELDTDGKYDGKTEPEKTRTRKTRPGYSVLPGVAAGIVAEILSLDNLLESKFWENTRFYQPRDFLWQATLLQPVGGMDRVQHSFVQQVTALGGNIHLNSPVKKIEWSNDSKKFKISVSQIGTDNLIEYEADYCVCNLPMPFLKKILSPELMKRGSGGFNTEFICGLKAVYKAQFNPSMTEDKSCEEYKSRFLADSTKIGWQADRELWQGSPINPKTCSVRKSEVGVVPIFGGISWTNNDIQQIWYPSSGFHDEKGIITGAYNFGEVAHCWGESSVADRLKKAREDASKFNRKFGKGLKDGLAIAWQNMPYIKGAWAYWGAVEDSTKHFNAITQGSGIYDSKNKEYNDPCFFIVGDQISSLPGWQEGAIAAAINVISRMAKPDAIIAHLENLPDTRLMVEGI